MPQGLGDLLDENSFTLLDTSVLNYCLHSFLTPEERKLIQKVYRRSSVEGIPAKIEYIDQLVQTVSKNENIFVTNKVVEESNHGFGVAVKGKQLRPYKKAHRNLMKTLKKRVISNGFFTDLTESFDENDIKLYSCLGHIMEAKELSKTDKDLIIKAINIQSFLGNANLVTNDKGMLISMLESNQFLKLMPNSKKNPAPILHKFEVYTTLYSDCFYKVNYDYCCLNLKEKRF